jgi:hypothetical protein
VIKTQYDKKSIAQNKKQNISMVVGPTWNKNTQSNKLEINLGKSQRFDDVLQSSLIDSKGSLK